MAVGSETEIQAQADAVDRGIAALKNKRQQHHWVGFPTRAGLSDVWVTAFVTAHLGEIHRAKKWLADSRRWLAAKQLDSGGWGYGGDVPADADSTSWCLMALRGSPSLSATSRRAALRLLANHWQADGVSTYLEGPESIRSYIKAEIEDSIGGWTSAHTDVTAAALLAGSSPPEITLQQAIAQLMQLQTGAGVWDAYWWRSPFYTTALLLRLLEQAKFHVPEIQGRRLLNALVREQRSNGGFSLGASQEIDVFSTALALDCFRRLTRFGSQACAQRAVEALLLTQSSKGDWPGGYNLRLPAPSVVEPKWVCGWRRNTGGGNSYVFDEDGVFATALAVYALGRADVARRNYRDLQISKQSYVDENVTVISRT